MEVIINDEEILVPTFFQAYSRGAVILNELLIYN